MRKRRRFTPEFKAKVVLEVLTGAQSPAEACRTHTLSPNLLGLWTATVLERAHTLFQPDEQRDEDQARIAELEQLHDRAMRQIEIEKKHRRCWMRPRPETGGDQDPQGGLLNAAAVRDLGCAPL